MPRPWRAAPPQARASLADHREGQRRGVVTGRDDGQRGDEADVRGPQVAAVPTRTGRGGEEQVGSWRDRYRRESAAAYPDPERQVVRRERRPVDAERVAARIAARHRHLLRERVRHRARNGCTFTSTVPVALALFGGGGGAEHALAGADEFCGSGAAVAKSAALSSESVQPPPARATDAVALPAGAAALPS